MTLGSDRTRTQTLALALALALTLIPTLALTLTRALALALALALPLTLALKLRSPATHRPGPRGAVHAAAAHRGAKGAAARAGCRLVPVRLLDNMGPLYSIRPQPQLQLQPQHLPNPNPNTYPNSNSNSNPSPNPNPDPNPNPNPGQVGTLDGAEPWVLRAVGRRRWRDAVGAGAAAWSKCPGWLAAALAVACACTCICVYRSVRNRRSGARTKSSVSLPFWPSSRCL